MEGYADFTPTLAATPSMGMPANYQNPEYLKAKQEYAKALMQGSGQQPVHHWTQGVSNMVAALLGHNLAAQTNQGQNEAQAVKAGNLYQDDPGNAPAPGMSPSARAIPYADASGQPQPFSEAPSSEGGKNTGDTLDSASKAIAGIESGKAGYSAVGNQTKTGDRAYGKYQVMGANIPEWTEATLGKSMTPDEFLASPEAQEAVFKNKFGEYTKKYGPEGAAKAWFAGEKGMKNPNASDVNGMTVSRYGQKFTEAAGGSPASAFSGEPANQNPAVQAISSALRGEPAGTQVAAGKPAMSQAGAAVAPNGSGMYVDPNLVQRRPQYNEGQMRGILADPTISEQTKMGLLQQYQNRNQPITMDYPGGKVLIDPRDPTKQQFIPDLHWGKKTLPGGLGYDVPSTVTPGPNGTVIQNNGAAPAGATGPRSDATPTAAPQGGPAATPAPVQAAAQTAPVAPATPPEAAQKPVQVASLDPAAGTSAFAPEATPGQSPLTPTEQQMLAMVKPGGTSPAAPTTPPDTPAVPPQTVAAGPAPSAPAANPIAQALGTGSKPPPGYTQDDWDAIQGYKKFENDAATDLKAREAEIDVNKTARNKNNELNAKRYSDMQDATSAAVKAKGNLDIASRMLEDKNFYSGFANDPIEGIKKISAALGIDPNAAAPMEVFRKTMASAIANGLKAAYGGLGQIRNKEIELQEKANGSLNNSPAANRALILISQRNAKQMADIGELAQEYRMGGEVTDPITGKVLMPANIVNGVQQERVGLDPKYDKMATDYLKAHPTFSPDELRDFNDIFDKPGEAAHSSSAGAATSIDTVQPGQTYKGMLFKGGDKTDQKNWERPKAP